MNKIVLFCFLLCGFAIAQIPSQYHSNNALIASVKKIAAQYPKVVSYRSIVTMVKGNDIVAVTIGNGDPDSKRALLVVGGIEATSVVGTEHALRFIEHLASSYGTVDSITALLNSVTVYVIPRANPDASEAFFQRPLTERETNFNPNDDDRDAAVDEDDVEDVNKDGVISWMRVTDPRGEWMIHPEDSRLLKKADPAKGEKGMYLLYSEGIDNDKDEEWNEDRVGGTDFNRNFTYNYQFFGKNSGVHQISENATRAIADFVFDHPNIGMIFTFSSNDNLLTAWKNEPPRGDSPAITSVTKEDEEYYGYIGKKFGEITKLKDAPKPTKGEGAFSEWGYYHAGRWSFAARPWWPGEVAKTKDSSAAKDTTKRSADPKKDDKSKSDDPAIKTLQWYDAVGIKDITVPWTEWKHPDFKNKKVEIGGVKPFVLNNPPAESLNAYAKPFAHFLTYLAGQMPSISLSNHSVEKVGSGLYRVTVDVVNKGFLPTNNGLGVRTRWVQNVRVLIDPGKGNTLSGGRGKQVIEPIKGNGGYRTLSWLVAGKGSVTVTAESPTAGRSVLTVDLP